MKTRLLWCAIHLTITSFYIFNINGQTSGDCKDQISNCKLFVGACKSLPQLGRQCKKTCKLCETDRKEVCGDTIPICAAYVFQCGTNQNVRSRCKKTCGICDEDEWRTWGEWEECDVTCGTGTQIRSRKCRPGQECEGESVQKRPCKNAKCGPADISEETFSKWSNFDKCSAKCGGGIHSRTRKCLFPPCKGHLREIQNCNMDTCVKKNCVEANKKDCKKFSNAKLCKRKEISRVCPVTCKRKGCEAEESWGEYGPCSVTCGAGLQTRKKGSSSQSITCLQEYCDEEPPKDTPEWMEWEQWGECSVTCGRGRISRTRKCTEEGKCKGTNKQTASCTKKECPGQSNCRDLDPTCPKQNCRNSRTRRMCPATCGRCIPSDVPDPVVWAEWAPWEKCSVTCGAGTKIRRRECPEDGMCTGSGTQTMKCNEKECVEWEDWSKWTPCTKSCGEGDTERIRSCSAPEGCEGNPIEAKKCNIHPCPEWADWSEWSGCNRDCGGGQMLRVRICTVSGMCGEPGPQRQFQECNMQLCKEWKEWSEWGDCSSKCGGGKKKRTRACAVNEGCKDLEGPAEEIQACNTYACPEWTEWSFWSKCSEDCGGGQTERTRFCSIPGECDLLPGGYKETEECNTDECPEWVWADWQKCNLPCGGGKRMREKVCTQTGQCQPLQPGDIEEYEDCNLQPCPEWAEWSDWSSCSKSCDTGERLRARNCKIDGQCHDLPGGDRETEGCNDHECPTWNEWGDWMSCSKDCGGGVQVRSRTCTIPDKCDGEDVETQDCNTDDCDEIEKWTECSKTCGEGTMRRYFCNGTECEWQFQGCMLDPCPIDICSFNPPEFLRYGRNDSCCLAHHLPSPEQCGRTADQRRVIGGVDAKAEQWPWMVAVHIASGGFCAGVLIKENIVLTAAHCFAYDTGKPKDTKNWRMYVGLLRLTEASLFPDLAIPIKRTFIHPDYNYPTADIAIVELEHDVAFTTTVKPICLPWGEETPIDSTCHVTGWGVSSVPDTVTNHLQELAILNVDPFACVESYKTVEELKHHVPFLETDKGYLCAGSLIREVDSCSGDSGGPLVCQRCDSCSWYVAGIVSFGPNPCARKGVPGIYTKVLYYEEWILKTTGMSKYSLSCKKP